MSRISAYMHVILPQALSIATPKITSIVIGLFDLLCMVQTVSGDPE